MPRLSVLMRSLMPIRRLSALLLTLAFGPAQVQHAWAQQTYEDGSFDVDGDILTAWSLYGPFFAPEDAVGADVGATAPRNGGNPDAFLRVRVTSVPVPRGESWIVWGLFIQDEAVYDPATLGAIEQIDFGFDARLPPDARGGVPAISLAVQQEGFLWAAVAPRIFPNVREWTPQSILALQESDFTAIDLWVEENQPQAPDFSESGAPISFGLMEAQSCPTTSDCSAPPTPIELDIDNWTVVVNGDGLPTGGTSGVGGASGAGGTAGSGGASLPDDGGEGCECRTAIKSGSSPWSFALLCLAMFALARSLRGRRRKKRS